MTPSARTLGELLSEFEEEERRPRRRYPVVRTGPRPPIPNIVRFSVYRRDGFRCRLCGEGREKGLELDHMLPWSAGGSDASDNLRTLCGDCNQERSNWFDHGHEKSKPATTWWCWECWRHPGMEDAPGDGYDVELPPQREFRPVWRDGSDMNRMPWVRKPEIEVYCAWCWLPGSWSDRAFVDGRQDALVAVCGGL